MSINVLRSSSLFLSTEVKIPAIRRISTCTKRCAGFQSASTGIPMQMKMRLIERKKKKIEKLARQPLELIPATDLFIPYSWKTEQKKRVNVDVSKQIAEQRILLEKEWARNVIRKRENEACKLKELIKQQELALKELRLESIDLYNKAVMCVSPETLPFTCSGPVQSLPLKNYIAPLGGFKHYEPPFSSDETVVLDSD